MDKQNLSILLVIILLFTLGLLGFLCDDPIQQIGIIAMIISGLGSVYLTMKLTAGMKSSERIFTVLASVICLLTVFRILNWPLPWFLLLSPICAAGLLGLIVSRSLIIRRTRNVVRSNVYLICGATTILVLLIDNIFRFGITTNSSVRLMILLFLLISGGWILRDTTAFKENNPALLVIFTYSTINCIAFVVFRIAELIQ